MHPSCCTSIVILVHDSRPHNVGGDREPLRMKTIKYNYLKKVKPI
jgi:hypothetical protein